MSDAAISEARKALNRLRRAAAKALHEMELLEGAIGRAEGGDFPKDDYTAARGLLAELLGFTDREAARLQRRVLNSGTFEPGRVRRSRPR